MTDAVAAAVAQTMMASDGQLSVCLLFQPTFFSSIAKLLLETFFSVEATAKSSSSIVVPTVPKFNSPVANSLALTIDH